MLPAPALRYGERMPRNAEEISPVRVPAAIGAAVLDAEPLRHGQGNVATGGIWRVRGPAGTAILKVARRPAGPDRHPRLRRRQVQLVRSGHGCPRGPR